MDMNEKKTRTSVITDGYRVLLKTTFEDNTTGECAVCKKETEMLCSECLKHICMKDLIPKSDSLINKLICVECKLKLDKIIKKDI